MLTDLPTLRIGIDIGGTFTDFVIMHTETGKIETFKLLSTPHDPAEVVMQGLARLPQRGDWQIVHGSTVATNALLERKGARTALIATRGFRDVLQIGRQNRPALYDFGVDPPPTLVPDELRFEVDERIGPRGAVITSLEPAQLDDLVAQLRTVDAQSVAVCLLFSFANPIHERMIAERLRAEGYFVSPSSEVLPEFREYERASTTVVNAYVTPILDGYLSRLEEFLRRPPTQGVEGVRLRVMQSNSGQISLSEARRSGVRCILSGPAGGVVGAWHVAGSADMAMRAAHPRVITFDMGGTSTDVSLIDGQPRLTTESVIGGCPIGVPVLDIHTIGAGGGSIARVDAGGALRVGPQSAGADPGPACYGRGDLPTVTDANLTLGRLSAEHFLGGLMPLDRERAFQALSQLGAALGLSAEQAALGVIEVANAHMERALRVISVERGHDPRDFSLLSFGGAGGLHAVALAERLGIPRLIIPPQASTLSAFGMLAADVVKDYAQTVMLPGETPYAEIEAAFSPMVELGTKEALAEGISPEDVSIECFLDMRYCGQSYELIVPFGEDFRERFCGIHVRDYGYAQEETPIEIVNLRLRAIGRVPPPLIVWQPAGTADASHASLGSRPVVMPDGSRCETPFYRGDSLRAGNSLSGPAIIVREDTTIFIGPDASLVVDNFLNLIVSSRVERSGA